MSYPFFNKAKINLDAAEKLNKEALYTPSIHCCYYGVLQYMLHVLSTKTINEWENYLIDIKKDSHSHIKLINIINAMLRQRNKKDFKYFDVKITELKAMRKKADYSSDIIKQEEAQLSITIANTLQNLLIENFR